LSPPGRTPTPSATPSRPIRRSQSSAGPRRQHGAGFDIVSGGELERVQQSRTSPPSRNRLLRRRQANPRDRRRPQRRHPPLQRRIRSRTRPPRRPRRSPQPPARFSLRVNPDVFAETHPYISTGLSEHKFGIDINAARAIYRKAEKVEVARFPPASASTSARRSAPSPPSPPPSTASQPSSPHLRKRRHNSRYIDAGGGLGIEYGTKPSTQPKQVAAYAAALTKRLPLGASPPRTRPLPRRPGRSPPHPRPQRQEKRHQNLRHHRRRHERPHPPRPLPGPPPDNPRPPARQASAAQSVDVSSAPSASPATSSPATAPGDPPPARHPRRRSLRQ
jgi:hypothetical protein